MSRRKKQGKSRPAGSGQPRGVELNTTPVVPTASEEAPIAAVSSSTVDVVPLPTLSELNDLAQKYRADENFAELLKLGRMAPFEIQSAPGENVRAWLALQRVRGLAGSESLSSYERFSRSPDRYALTDALKALCEYQPDLHLLPEFELYIRSLGYGPRAALSGYALLMRACEAQPHRMQWLETLRGYTLRLLDDDEERFDPEERLTPEEQDRVRQSDLDVSLREAFDNASQVEDMDPDDRVLLTALRADLDMRLAEPWEGDKVRAWVKRLEPDAALRAACYEASRECRSLTPTAWVFQWELANVSPEQLPGLLARHANGFNDLRCEGLRLVARALSQPDSGDEELLAGLSLLARDVHAADGLYGHSLALRTADGVRHHPVGWENFYTPELYSQLSRLVEVCEMRHPRSAAMQLLAHLWEQASKYEAWPDDDPRALAYDVHPGLAWLCEHIPGVSLQVATHLPLAGVRLRRHLELVLTWAQQGGQAQDVHLMADFEGVQLGEQLLNEMLSLLEKLSALKESLSEPLLVLLDKLVLVFFQALKGQLPMAYRGWGLDIALQYADVLVKADCVHPLAWIAHEARHYPVAVELYVRMLRGSGAHKAWALKNLHGLLGKLTALEDTEVAIRLLTQAEFAPDQEPNRASLLVTARSSRAAIEQKEQYERTAVNRWPKLTQPARQILSVLDQIKSYRGFAELGSYAGMDATWAQRHYDKLVETGMVLVGPNGYTINPHIAPLLARENQHSVVGRIVRASGTTAVKQVFNSQREFNIYQVLVQLCPNHLVFPNCGLQSFMAYERMKELVEDDDFGYYLRASVDVLVVSSTTYLPLLAIEVDSVWHDTERQTKNDGKKDRLFAAAGVPFLRLRPVGNPSEAVIRGQVAEHLNDLVRTLREDMPGYDQARTLLLDLSKA